MKKSNFYSILAISIMLTSNVFADRLKLINTGGRTIYLSKTTSMYDPSSIKIGSHQAVTIQGIHRDTSILYHVIPQPDYLCAHVKLHEYYRAVPAFYAPELVAEYEPGIGSCLYIGNVTISGDHENYLGTQYIHYTGYGVSPDKH